jgi:hypothetical protein
VGVVFGSYGHAVHIQLMSELINLETSGYFMARFVVQGKVKSAPRVVSNFIPGEVKDLATFRLVTSDSVLVRNGELFEMQGAIKAVHEKTRQTFAGGSYTDEHGIICDFSAPQAPWWVAISEISWALLEKFEDWPFIEGTTNLKTGEVVQ